MAAASPFQRLMLRHKIPHFGGNQGPGYPFFVALNWWLFDHSNLATRITQNAALCSSIIYFVLALEKFMSCRKKAAIIGIIIAVSPCTVAWPRFMQTETLALAGTLWIFSALLNSVTQKNCKYSAFLWRSHLHHS